MTEPTGQHIDHVSRCQHCPGQIEHVAGIKDPFWRHINASSLGQPHAATPSDGVYRDGLPRNATGGVSLAALDAMPGYLPEDGAR